MIDKLKQHWKVISLATLIATASGIAWMAHLVPAHKAGAYTEHPTALRSAFEDDPVAWLAESKDFSTFEADVAAGKVAEVGINSLGDANSIIFVTLQDHTKYSTEPVVTPDRLASLLNDASARRPIGVTRVKVDLRSPSEHFNAGLSKVVEGGGRALAIALPLALLILFAKQFGAKKNNLLTSKPSTRFDDVIGVSEAKASLAEVASFLQDPSTFTQIGARAPRGVLLEGPPGTGKTLLARALAGECGANFIAIDGSYFSSMFYEQGIKRVSALFKAARANAPCVIFIDEIDGIGARSSGASRSNGQGEENRIINRLLVELDGFSPADNVVVIAATNHRENIDPALLRPGRFDQMCQLTMPTLAERAALFDCYLQPVKVENRVDTTALGRATGGMSPADIAQVVNRAALMAAETKAHQVSMEHLQSSLESIQLGGRVSNVKTTFSDATRERIANHEAGHAIVAHVAGAGQVGRISIEPRGQALGVTFVSRDEETPLYGEAELRARLAMMLGGREAELMVYASTTSGASDDLKQASSLAMRMVTELGFSKEFGVLSFSGIPAEFVSAATKERALEEARELLAKAQQQCRTILVEHRRVLESIVTQLVRDETISPEQFKAHFGDQLGLAA